MLVVMILLYWLLSRPDQSLMPTHLNYFLFIFVELETGFNLSDSAADITIVKLCQ